MSAWPEPATVPEPRRRLALLTACPYLYVGEAGTKGLGVFTARGVAAGAVLVADEDGTLRSRALPLAAALAQGWDRQRDLFQLDHDLFLPPRGCFDDLFNHSCAPSGGWMITGPGARFVAIRDLAAGEELTYDYSCHLLGRDELMACACGSATCRRVIGPFHLLPAWLRRYYLDLGVVSAAVQRSAA
jgi:hypothetical protein